MRSAEEIDEHIANQNPITAPVIGSDAYKSFYYATLLGIRRLLTPSYHSDKVAEIDKNNGIEDAIRWVMGKPQSRYLV